MTADLGLVVDYFRARAEAMRADLALAIAAFWQPLATAAQTLRIYRKQVRIGRTAKIEFPFDDGVFVVSLHREKCGLDRLAFDRKPAKQTSLGWLGPFLGAVKDEFVFYKLHEVRRVETTVDDGLDEGLIERLFSKIFFLSCCSSSSYWFNNWFYPYRGCRGSVARFGIFRS